jgi:hypothetical protein
MPPKIPPKKKKPLKRRKEKSVGDVYTMPKKSKRVRDNSKLVTTQNSNSKRLKTNAVSNSNSFLSDANAKQTKKRLLNTEITTQNAKRTRLIPPAPSRPLSTAFSTARSTPARPQSTVRSAPARPLSTAFSTARSAPARPLSTAFSTARSAPARPQSTVRSAPARTQSTARSAPARTQSTTTTKNIPKNNTNANTTFQENEDDIVITIRKRILAFLGIPSGQRVTWTITKKNLFERFPFLKGKRMQTFISLLGDFAVILLMSNAKYLCYAGKDGAAFIDTIVSFKEKAEKGMGFFGFSPDQLGLYVRLGEVIANLAPNANLMAIQLAIQTGAHKSGKYCKKVTKQLLNKGVMSTMKTVAWDAMLPIMLGGSLLGALGHLGPQVGAHCTAQMQIPYIGSYVSTLFAKAQKFDEVGLHALFEKSKKNILALKNPGQRWLFRQNSFIKPPNEFLKLMTGLMGDLINQKILNVGITGVLGEQQSLTSKLSAPIIYATGTCFMGQYPKLPFVRSLKDHLQVPAAMIMSLQDYLLGN